MNVMYLVHYACVSVEHIFLLDSLRVELTDHMFRENSLVSVYVFWLYHTSISHLQYTLD